MAKVNIRTDSSKGGPELAGRSAAAYDMNEVQKHNQNLDSLTSYVMPNMSAEEQARWNEWTSWAKNVIQQPGGAVAPQQGAQTTQTAIAPGVTSMFNSPENIQRIADLLSKAESGLPIDEVMEEIRQSTGLSAEAFWKEIGSIGKTAGENPFAKKDDADSDDSEDKEESGEKDGGNEKGDGDKAGYCDACDRSNDSCICGEGDDKKEEPKKYKAESKSEPKEEKEEEAEEEVESPEWEKRDIKLAKRALDLLKKLMKREKQEEGELPKIEDLKEAMELVEHFIKKEKEELPGADMADNPEDMATIEKTGPDLPPALEGLALPLSEPAGEDAEGMKVIDLAPPVMPLIAAEAESELTAESKKKLPKGFKPFPKKDDKGDDKNPFAKDEKKSSLKLHDRVWRKADFGSGFETVGDEPGRIVEFGNGKAIVDWGHEDGVPTEENPADLMLAAAAQANENFMFIQPAAAVANVEPIDASGSPTGPREELDIALRETSLHDILAKHAEGYKTSPDAVTHIASGKTAKILHRLANGQMRVAVDGKELVLWNYEVE